MKPKLFAFLVLFGAFCSCSKNETMPGQTNEPKTVVAKIVSVKLSNVIMDTVWQSLDTITKNFDTPQKELDFGNIYKDVLDSIHIDLDSLEKLLSFEKNVLLPTIITDSLQLLVGSRDSLIISDLPFEKGFYAKNRPVTTDKYNGSILNIRIVAKYKRIYTNADATIRVIDINNNYLDYKIKIKSSVIGQLSLGSYVW